MLDRDGPGAGLDGPANARNDSVVGSPVSGEDDGCGSARATNAPALALVVITMLRPLRRIFGLSERIFLLTTNVWFALAAGLLISRLH